jgi:hypothetical protein
MASRPVFVVNHMCAELCFVFTSPYCGVFPSFSVILFAHHCMVARKDEFTASITNNLTVVATTLQHVWSFA